jgi:hypothetical protein
MITGMKFPAFFLGLALATGVAFAETPKPADAAKPAEPAKSGVTTPPADAKKKEEPMGKIEGIELARPNGLWLGLKVENGNFKLTFYNKKKKPATVDVTRALVRWPNVHGTGDNRTVMNPDGAHSLVGTKFVRGPYTFKLFLTLMKGEGDAAVVTESYTVDFHD